MPRANSSPNHAAGPALAMLQITDVPRGLSALDALVKEAPVTVLGRGTVQCGHYLIAFGGELEAVSRSLARALQRAEGVVLDRVLVPDVEPRIAPAFVDAVVRPPSRSSGDALGIVQSPSCPVLLGAIDLALKGARVELVELRMAEGLGGKALATLWGDLTDVEAAIELTCEAAVRHASRGGPPAAAMTTSIMANADEELERAVAAGTRFFREWRG